MRKDRLEELRCLGSSMKPMLRSLDKLTLAPYHGKRMRPGDVIVFSHPADGHRVAHRIAAVNPGRVLTKGDNNSRIDPIAVSREAVIGRVVYLQRGRRRFRVHGGRMGRLQGLFFKMKRLPGEAASVLLGPVYRALAKTGIALRLVPVQKKIRTVVFRRPQGEETQIFMGSLLIARRRAPSDNWFVRKPFRLFVESYLKNGETH